MCDKGRYPSLRRNEGKRFIASDALSVFAISLALH
jgi:hypothetical protein